MSLTLRGFSALLLLTFSSILLAQIDSGTLPLSGDQCNYTSQCRAHFGSLASDCKNSSSSQSVCMCGTSACNELIPTKPSPSPTPALPSGKHQAPGLIQAEDFARFSDTTSHNSGGQYRDSAVDIQTTSDSGGGYNIGWTAAGEWLEYDLQVVDGGTYDIHLRTASPSGSGSISVLINGKQRALVSTANTGGWQNWQDIRASVGELNANNYKLRIKVETAGFNLNWLELKRTGPLTPPAVIDQCNSTNQCRVTWPLANDCKNSASNQSVCMCGSERCDAQPSVQPTPPTNNDTPVWKAYLSAKKEGKNLPLPNFAYAGYDNANTAIPKPSWQVFNVKDYGAVANDNGDDLHAIQQTINAASKKDGAIVFFPRGRYLVSERKGITSSLLSITGSKLILRGEGSGANGSVLFFREHLNSTTPSKKWTTPAMIVAKGTNSGSTGNSVAKISKNAKLGDLIIQVSDSSKLNAGDHIYLNLNDSRAANSALSPFQIENEWSKFKQGQFSRELHKIERVSGNKIYLKTPLYTDINSQYNWEVRKTSLAHSLGFEDLRFEGNWKDNFVHHKNIIHDGGWTAMRIGNYHNSWLSNVHFKDWNATVTIVSSHSITVDGYVDSGNRGHSSLNLQNASSILVSNSKSIGARGQHHGFGVSNYASGNVFHRVSWPQGTSFDTHASFPRATLFDRAEGGFSGVSGFGGSQSSQPNHMEDLIFWNFFDKGQHDGVYWDWWRNGDSKYGRWLLPSVIGWHGAQAQFNNSELELKESHGQKVSPESLYEAQLKERFGFVPSWIK
ncbi:DUF4955 domain-containing protein [Agaribacterium sp. ZY112]|uniref:DUF4955 domain-containing protein n=1 Tax=Agaribacterium sp. ZY112 TaxID=3233574 RepID=UPI003526A42E